MTPRPGDVIRAAAVLQHRAALLRQRLPITPAQLDENERANSRLASDSDAAIRELLDSCPVVEAPVHYRPLETDEDWTTFDQGMCFAFDSAGPWHRIVRGVWLSKRQASSRRGTSTESANHVSGTPRTSKRLWHNFSSRQERRHPQRVSRESHRRGNCESSLSR